jgi:V8-like Glu-specific endopeptidase
MSQSSYVGGSNGGQLQHLNHTQVLAGVTGGNLETDSTDAFVPDHRQVLRVDRARTKPFRVKNADRIKEITSDELKLVVERDQVTDYRSYPFSCIGKLFVGANNNYTAPLWTGSAALVGSNLLLTASHCAPWNSTGTGAMAGWWMRFVPSYNYGSEPYGFSYVSDFRGIHNTQNVTGLDYVICRLYNRLGDTCGWLGSRWWSDDRNYMASSWTSVGYPGDSMNGQVMMIERNIALHDVDPEGTGGRELEAHTFSTPGWSGGPMFGNIGQQQKCVGVMSGKLLI